MIYEVIHVLKPESPDVSESWEVNIIRNLLPNHRIGELLRCGDYEWTILERESPIDAFQDGHKRITEELK
jgi:hypothetical protein